MLDTLPIIVARRTFDGPPDGYAGRMDTDEDTRDLAVAADDTARRIERGANAAREKQQQRPDVDVD